MLAQVQFWAPAAGGAGVSLIMAYLNGNAIPDLLSARSLITKWVGTVCGVCANIALGPEAPAIHMGACVAHNITHLACCEPPLLHSSLVLLWAEYLRVLPARDPLT